MLVPTALEKAATEALKRGATAQAETLLRQALDQGTQDYRSAVMLSYLLRTTGRVLEAAQLAESAIPWQPQLVEAPYQCGLALMELQQPTLAVVHLQRVTEIRPQVAEFHLNLAIALEAAGLTTKAEMRFRRVLELDPKNLSARVSLARHLLGRGDLEGAATHAGSAVKAHPNSVYSNLAMAEICQAEGRWISSEPFVRKALELEPGNALAHTFNGMRNSQMGRFDVAEREYRLSLQANPRQGLTYLHLTHSRQVTLGDNRLISEMERLRDSGSLHGEELSNLQFALGKSYDDLGEYQKAMAAYDDANRVALQSRYGIFPSYDFSAVPGLESAKSLQEVFSNSTFNGVRNDISRSELPLFIVGMIRSGTTLTERILSSHPDVAPGGEIRFWGESAASLAAMKDLWRHSYKADSVRSEYLNLLHSMAPTVARVTDKLPGNYQRLGLLHKLLPEARIIHCRRSAVDTAISIYTTPNGAAVAPMHSKRGIVTIYKHYLEVMAYWREVLPTDRFLEVQYEELVGDPEPSIRRMVEFCGLVWNPACLHPETNEAEVKTPSFWQVRQPIHRSSVDRWKRYKPWLGELAELVGIG